MAGLLLVISGPSGAGKSTVLSKVMANRADISFSVSVTTRPPRAEEREGQDYFFVSPVEFIGLRDSGRLLEVGTFAGNWYGTPRDAVLARLNRGEIVVLDIESAGAAQVKERMPEAVLIFLTPSTEEEAERRLRSRGTENESSILKRLASSRPEYMHINKYQYIVVNDKLEDAVATLEAIILAECSRTERRTDIFRNYREL
jgi:guanylate kinase